MARKPNYGFERRERERLKAEKKAAKAEAKRKRKSTTEGADNATVLNGGLKPESD